MYHIRKNYNYFNYALYFQCYIPNFIVHFSISFGHIKIINCKSTRNSIDMQLDKWLQSNTGKKISQKPQSFLVIFFYSITNVRINRLNGSTCLRSRFLFSLSLITLIQIKNYLFITPTQHFIYLSVIIIIFCVNMSAVNHFSDIIRMSKLIKQQILILHMCFFRMKEVITEIQSLRIYDEVICHKISLQIIHNIQFVFTYIQILRLFIGF